MDIICQPWIDHPQTAGNHWQGTKMKYQIITVGGIPSTWRIIPRLVILVIVSLLSGLGYPTFISG